jgi:hypothetical protein
MVREIKTFFNFLRVSFWMLKYAAALGLSSDEKARILITQARWHISKTENKNIKKELLKFIDKMEETRFPNDK